MFVYTKKSGPAPYEYISMIGILGKIKRALCKQPFLFTMVPGVKLNMVYPYM